MACRPGRGRLRAREWGRLVLPSGKGGIAINARMCECGNREDALPNVPVASSKDARHHPSAKTGAERLGSLAWHGVKAKADDHPGTAGFESPQTSKVRHEVWSDALAKGRGRAKGSALAVMRHHTRGLHAQHA
jgi:hypothetical protein